MNMKFSIWNLGNLVYRTRLKLAAEMLYFREYGDFADYFGPRWHYYLGDVIGAIPMPVVMERGYFGNGVEAKILQAYAENPFPFLAEDGRKKMRAELPPRRHPAGLDTQARRRPKGPGVSPM